MLIALKNVAGDKVGDIELSDAVFAAPVNKPLMHQALVRQLANARLGTHDTKERWEVRGGGKKPWRQKGTGRARQGSIRAGQWIGGGTVFGPTPRKYTQSLNKKMQHAALRSALSVKASAGQIVVVDELRLNEPKTKQVVRVLNNLGVSSSVLMVLAEKNEPVWRSANNLPTVKTLLSGLVNVRDLLGYDTVLLSKDALEHLELWLGNDVPASQLARASKADSTGAQVMAAEATPTPAQTEADSVADEPVPATAEAETTAESEPVTALTAEEPATATKSEPVTAQTPEESMIPTASETAEMDVAADTEEEE